MSYTLISHIRHAKIAGLPMLACPIILPSHASPQFPHTDTLLHEEMHALYRRRPSLPAADATPMKAPHRPFLENSLHTQEESVASSRKRVDNAGGQRLERHNSDGGRMRCSTTDRVKRAAAVVNRNGR